MGTLRTIGICARCAKEKRLLPSFGVCAYCRQAQLKGRAVMRRPEWGVCERCERERRLLDGRCAKCRDLTQRGHAARRTPEWRQKISDGQVGPKNPNWRGGRFTDKNGYVWVLATDDPLAEAMLTSATKGYVQEHRLVMARALGRALRDDETVHHIGGDHSDNRLSKLQLRQGAHGKGIVLQCQTCGSHDVAAVPLADFNAAHSLAV